VPGARPGPMCRVACIPGACGLDPPTRRRSGGAVASRLPRRCRRCGGRPTVLPPRQPYNRGQWSARSVPPGRPWRLCLAALRQALTHRAMTPGLTPGAADDFAAAMNVQAQTSPHRPAGQKAPIALVLQAVEEACARRAPPFTPAALRGAGAGNAWGGDHSRSFHQRASSAVAGRHGSRPLRRPPHPAACPHASLSRVELVHTFDVQARTGRHRIAVLQAVGPSICRVFPETLDGRCPALQRVRPSLQVN